MSRSSVSCLTIYETTQRKERGLAAVKRVVARGTCDPKNLGDAALRKFPRGAVSGAAPRMMAAGGGGESEDAPPANSGRCKLISWLG